MEKIYCKCGCGKMRLKFDKKGRRRNYINGHQGKVNWGKLTHSWNKGRKNVYSQETLKKMSKAKLGKPSHRKGESLSKTTKNKIRITKLIEWSHKKQSKSLKRLKVNAKAIAQKIPLNKFCDICKSKINLQRHHWRYDKPLLVNTLCKQCHTLQHLKNFQQSKYGGLS